MRDRDALPTLSAVRTAFALLIAALGIFGNGCSKISKTPETDGAVSGTIETDQARVASRYGGRVTEILSQEGDGVRSNQVIVRLEASELFARHGQLAAQLAEWKAGARKEELATAKAEMEAIAADLEFARSEERRTAQLANTGAIAASERDRALSRANTLERSLAAAKSRLELLQAGTRPERIAAAEAQLGEVETHIKELEVRAPAPAVVETLHVKLGDVLSPNMPVVTLLYTNHLWLRVYVPATWLGHLHLADKVRVRVDSFPNKNFEGVIEQIARSAEFTPRNVQTQEDRIKQVFGVKVRLPGDTGELRAGMSADVFFNVPRAK